ncbi:MAG: hypothetical protein IT165_18530 [Bryobacterales bacterium]|nr:hypothetical protein [Bryobacterales bacterium]
MNLNLPENGYRSRIRTSARRLARWNGAWVAATALMAFGPKFFWDRALVFTLLAVGLDLAVGVGVILANKKYVAELDELQRKVYLNALAITVGVTMIAGVPYSVMGSYHVIPFKADAAYLLILMTLTFCVTFLYGTWRYR